MYTLLCALRSFLHMVWMVVSIMPWALAVVIARFVASGRTTYAIARAWLYNCVASLRLLCGVQWRVTGLEHLPPASHPTVVLSKHQSTLETFLLPSVLPRQLGYVFKKELLYVPFFGWAIGSLPMIHIDRSQRREAFNKVVAQGRKLSAQGVWVTMFPEGTRIPRGQAGDYKLGGARFAIETGSCIIPIAVSSAKCWPRKGLIKYPGVVDVVIGAPISSSGKTPEALMNQVQDWIEREMQRIDPEAYASKQANA